VPLLAALRKANQTGPGTACHQITASINGEQCGSAIRALSAGRKQWHTPVGDFPKKHQKNCAKKGEPVESRAPVFVYDE
jgi:hypothetical protein